MLSQSLDQLYTFLVVVRQGTLSAAAEALYVSQPAVSLQLKQLETRLGLPLMERRGRRLVPTATGQLVYSYAQRIFGLVEELERELANQRDLRSGHLVVGASTTIGEYLLPEVLGRFHARYPGIELTLTIANTAHVIDVVLRNELDFGFVGAAPTLPELLVLPYAEDAICFVASANHPLTARPVTLAALAGERLILREPGSATRQQAQACLRAAGVEIQVAMELGSNEAVKSAVAAGLGLGLLSKHALKAELAAGLLQILPVAGWDCRRTFYLIRRKARRLSRPEEAFLAFLGQPVR